MDKQKGRPSRTAHLIAAYGGHDNAPRCFCVPCHRERLAEELRQEIDDLVDPTVLYTPEQA